MALSNLIKHHLAQGCGARNIKKEIKRWNEKLRMAEGSDFRALVICFCFHCRDLFPFSSSPLCAIEMKPFERKEEKKREKEGGSIVD